MAIYVEVVKSKNETPVKGAKVILLHQDGTKEEAVTEETGIAEFSQSGAVTISVDGQVYQTQIEIDDEETVTIAMDESKISKLRLLKKIRLHSVNSNPLLPANQANQRQVSLHIQAPAGKLKHRRPSFNISLVLDYSSSMMGDKIYYATETAVSLLNLMHKDDHVSIVTFNQSSHVIFPSRKLSREARDVFIEQIQQPALDEQSDLSAGWLTGVEQVLDHKTEDTLNWVLLFTDGRGDAGLTDQDELTAKAKDLQQQGINTYTFGVGDDADQPLLQAVAEAGGGKFYFIEQPDKSPNYLQNWLKQFGATMQTGHSAVVELTVPDNIQVTLLQPISHTKQLGNFRISLGEIFALQHHHIPLMLQLPPYPAGQHIYLPVALHYNDAQSLMPIVARTIPLCFTVVDSVRQKKEASKASETLTPPPVQSLQPASRLWWTNPVFAVLSGGILFLMTALLAVGTLLLVSTKSEPAAVVDDTANQPVVVEEEEEDTEIILPKPTETETPVSATDTPESTGITTGRDEIILPTKTPTPQPTPTPTATYVPQTAQPVEGLQVGNLAPDFTLGSTRDTRVSLSELQGKIVILNFWASWCGYCTIEVPALESIHNEYGPQGVVVLAVNQGENLQTVERFAWNNGIHFTVWLDEDAWAGNIYQVRGIPTTYFIDREGIIQAVHPGTRTREQFVAELEKLLE